MHLWLEGHAGDDVLEVLLGDLVIGLVDQTATHSLDDVRAERAPLQTGGVSDEDMQIPLMQRLDILRRGGVCDDNFSTQVVG
ncbi:MAG: hypothetical protein U9N80_02705 [Chloroflexota bacterium]|nr:hypothetical protein [Chloroflexota bacterium]